MLASTYHSVVEGRELGRKVGRQLTKKFFRPNNEDSEGECRKW
jgi:hypothetical protein